MSEYIPRLLSEKILSLQKDYPVILVTGPRQSGKTEMCKHIFPDYAYFNLEDLTTRGVASSDPSAFIRNAGEKAIIDEVQNVPQLLSMIQVVVDEKKERRFVLTGSSSFQLLSGSAQSLAGRVAIFTLLPFSLLEFHDRAGGLEIDELMFEGGYPGVVALQREPNSFYKYYYNTYVERDVRDLLKVKNIIKFDFFVRLVAARCGSEFNASAISREVGISSTTAGEWLSILCSSYITYMLRPYYSNVAKRLTKMPKVYFYDSGLLCFLLGIDNPRQLSSSMERGRVFENLAMSELLKGRINARRDPNLFFYREHSGKEVDALIKEGDGLRLYEIKSGRTYKAEYTAGMSYLKSLLPDVKSCSVIYDGPSVPPAAINIRDL